MSNYVPKRIEHFAPPNGRSFPVPPQPAHPAPAQGKPRLVVLLSRSYFFSISAVLHVVLILLLGTLVLFDQVKEPPDFSAGGDGTGFITDSEPTGPKPTTPETPPDVPEIQTTVSTSVPLPDTDAITTSALSPVSMPAAMVAAPALDSSNVARTMDTALANVGQRVGRGGTGAFGSSQMQREGALLGILYDLKQTPDGKDTGVDPNKYNDIVTKFAREKFREGFLSQYYRCPKPLYASQIMIPNMKAEEGPKAFGVQDKVKPSRWLVHYKGRVCPPESGTYHFVGAGDDLLIVKFNGKIVLDRCWYVHTGWKPEKTYDYGTGFPGGYAQGDAMRVSAGQWYDIEVLIGEQPGGFLFASLLLEQEGETYEKDKRGNPILPVFRFDNGPLAELKPGQSYGPYQPDGRPWKAQAAAAPAGSGLDSLRPVIPASM